MSDLHRLVYTSRNHLEGDEAEMSAAVLEILKTSQRNNARVGLTGALLFNKGAFAQVLEGPSRAVEDTFERIQRDERHGDVTVLQCGQTAERRFGNWSMAFVGGSPRGQRQWNDFAEKSGFDVTRMDGDAVFAMLHGLMLEEEGAPQVRAPAPTIDGTPECAGALDAEQVRAELSELDPVARTGLALPLDPRRGHPSSVAATEQGSGSGEDAAAVAVLRQALADERKRTTDLRGEIDDLRIAAAESGAALFAARQERKVWVERARLLALAIAEQAESLHAVDAPSREGRSSPRPTVAPARSAA